jgi:selT/selW/selH-like putative selenoprotein
LEAAIKRAFGIQPDLVRGSGGVFDVVADGEKVFSKWEANRFPTNQEILTALARRVKTAE